MSLPPGFIDELRSRLSLAQVVGRKVTWDARKSNQARGDHWAPCPFHQEKTASFHVDDRKGFYYCFGCHAKGDAISFVRETENASFMEAVEILAREAGMTMPARDPKAQERADRRSQLIEVVEMAQRYFRLQLASAAGAEAREYLTRRGLDADAQARWELGFAPDAWQGLGDHLRGKGVSPELILAAGLVRESQKGGQPYDVFRDRIIFPIQDARGRTIAFGGRAMDPGDAAKYLNSPQTELFDKGATLYNLHRAREAAGKDRPLIVAEGYMDVIALSEAGFPAAVAPLGTAVTEVQLSLAWRVSEEPVIALDGDAAGLRAAYRVIDLALPLLESGRGVRFALMPVGQDPDDLIRAGGASAVAKVLAAARPMVDLLWRRETEGRTLDSPERRAALDRSLRDAIGRIRDPGLRRHYGDAIREMRWQAFRQAPGKRRFRSGTTQKTAAAADTRQSALATGPAEVGDHMREATVLAILLRHPELAAEFEAGLESLACAHPDAAAIRDAMMRYLAAPADLPKRVAEVVGMETLDAYLRQSHLTIHPCLRGGPDMERARITVAEDFAKLAAARGLAAEIEDAAQDVAATEAEALTWRLRQAAEAVRAARETGQEDRTEFDVAENGARVSRDERDAFGALLDSIRYGRRTGSPD